MNNRGVTLFLTSIVTVLCLYYLSFSLLDIKIHKQATHYATLPTGEVDLTKKQVYLDSVWNEPVFTCLGFTYTYEQVKENALNLGLDLQGGMHVTLEISPSELIRTLAGRMYNESVAVALESAVSKQYEQRGVSFTQLFYQAYKKEQPSGKLADIFVNASNRSRLDDDAPDATVLKYLDNEIEQAVIRAYEIIQARIDRFGTTQPTIQRLPHTGKIQIEFPGVNNPERVRKLLQGVAQLRFWEVYEMKETVKILETINQVLVAEEKEQSQKAGATTERPSSGESQALAQQLKQQDSADAAFVSPIFKLLKPGYVGLTYAVGDVKVIQEILERPSMKAWFPKDLLWLWDAKPHIMEDGTQVMNLYAIRTGKNKTPLLEGDVVADARQVFDERGRPAVNMQMKLQGAKVWRAITASHIGKSIAIALDDKVYSAPTVRTEIADRNSQITGNFTLEESQDLANILRAGSLPTPVKITEEAIVGPTLSKVAQVQGFLSMAIGLGAVIVFMLVYYAQGGLVANIALLFNVVFIMGILAQLSATLTMAGIAGIVLTIGMTVDANVLIFERIREERRKGAGIKEALRLGYQKAYSSIIDSNLTTFLVGVILYILGQGPVRGFATTLMIGIATSFFTAVLLTRFIFGTWVGLSKEKNVTFAFSYNENMLNHIQLPFFKNRRFFYACSLIFIVIGLVLTGLQKGLNLGVDFTGGRSYVITCSEPLEPSELKAKLVATLKDQSTEVKTYGATHMVKITTNYRVDEEDTAAEEAVKNTLIECITKATGLAYVEDLKKEGQGGFMITSTTKVGPSIADDMQASAKKSILLSLIGIFFYILVRFRRWQFGLAAVIALLHDSLTVFAAFAIARAFGFSYEIDQVFVAALLTIIGYSINDTVVIFDRIREMQRLHPSNNWGKLVNQSINQTLSRTLITSFTTLLAVFILFVWGGESLRGFSFALLVGIGFGTYSSICIASPLAVDLLTMYSKKVKKTV